jgi:hypothetical protein
VVFHLHSDVATLSQRVDSPKKDSMRNQLHRRGARLALTFAEARTPMKRAIPFALITAAIVLLMAPAAAALAADRVGDHVQYDVMAEQVFVGAIHDKPIAVAGRMYFTLWTSNGAVAVEIGPKEFVERSRLKLGSGQTVTVVGMPIVINHREMVLAREVLIGGSVFTVRDRNGEPMWEMDRPIQIDPGIGDNSLPVC